MLSGENPFEVWGSPDVIRDFIYVKDVVKVIDWFIENKNVNGLFNVGSGKPQSFKDLSKLLEKNALAA